MPGSLTIDRTASVPQPSKPLPNYQTAQPLSRHDDQARCHPRGGGAAGRSLRARVHGLQGGRRAHRRQAGGSPPGGRLRCGEQNHRAAAAPGGCLRASGVWQFWARIGGLRRSVARARPGAPTARARPHPHPALPPTPLPCHPPQDAVRQHFEAQLPITNFRPNTGSTFSCVDARGQVRGRDVRACVRAARARRRGQGASATRPAATPSPPPTRAQAPRPPKLGFKPSQRCNKPR